MISRDYINLIMIIIGRIAQQCFSRVSTALSRFVQPVNLPLRETQTFPTLELKSEKHLLNNWWSEAPFKL